MSTQTGPLGLKSKFTLAAFAGLALYPFAVVRSEETGVEVISVQGTANFSGSELPLEILMDRQGRFRETIGGWANQVTGFDGQTLWRIDDGAGPCQIDFLERELMLAAHWMWLSQRRDVESIQLQENTMQVAGGLLTFSISDRDGPGVQLIATNSPGQETIQIHQTKESGGFRIPKQIDLNTGFPLKSCRIGHASLEWQKPGWFEMPPYSASGVTFDVSRKNELVVRKATTGHLFVKPLISGEDAGWFLFDSGAGGSIVKADVADRFKFPVVGSMMTGGVGGETGARPLRQGSRIQLGPMTIDSLNFVESPAMTDKASHVLGEPVSGVLGWDVLLRSIVEVDMTAGSISVSAPDQYHLDKKHSERLFLHWQVPYVEARFEGNRTGKFMLDTGAGNRGIIFHSLAVDRLGLLDNRSTTSGEVRGAGGKVVTEQGQLDWFQIADHWTHNVEAVFLRGDDGEADLYTEGFLGGSVLRNVKVVFDYPQQRVGFVPSSRQRDSK